MLATVVEKSIFAVKSRRIAMLESAENLLPAFLFVLPGRLGSGIKAVNPPYPAGYGYV